MKTVTIRRCPTCQNIVSHADHLAAELRNDPKVKVEVVDGNKGEFAVEVNGRTVNAKSGESLRDPSELVTEIRGAEVTSAG